MFLQAGDEVRVRSGGFEFFYGGNRYHVYQGQVRLQCRHAVLWPGRPRRTLLAVWLQFGQVRAPGGSLLPCTDSEPPIIGIPRIFSDGRVIVGALRATVSERWS